MNNLILFILVFLSFPIFAQEFSSEFSDTISETDTPVVISSFEAEKVERKFNPYKGHWLTAFGFETGRYDVPWEFAGARKNLRPTKQDLTGGRLGLGREIYLGKGLMTSTRVEGYYIGSLFTSAINAAPEAEDVEFASTKKTGSLWGIDAVQTLSYLFDMKTKSLVLRDWSYLTVEPFVEAGIGKAYAYSRVNYKYQLQTINEFHRQRISDDLVNTRVGAGVNITSSKGYFLYLRATVNSYIVTQRKMRERTMANGGSESSITSTDKSVDIDPVTIYALGGGYKF